MPVLFPCCFGCGKLSFGSGVKAGGRTCSSCRKKFHIYGFISPFSYKDELTHKLIHSFKYERVCVIGEILGKQIGSFMLKEGIAEKGGKAVIVPVPLHSSRQRTRGFNQALIIAEAIGKTLQIGISRTALAKIRKTKPQVGLSGEARQENVKGTFAVRSMKGVNGFTVFLIDDVKTTGATLEEAAKTLKAAGAKKIIAVAAAR